MKGKKLQTDRYKVYNASQVRQNGYVGFLNMAWAAGRFSLDPQHRSAPKIQLETVRFASIFPLACRQCEFGEKLRWECQLGSNGTGSPNLVTVVFGQKSR